MSRFNYKAAKANGEVYEGIRESVSKISLYSELKSEGEILINASEIFAKTKKRFNFGDLGGVPMHQKIIFAKNLGAMISAGLPLAKALSIIEKQVKNKKFKGVIFAMEAGIRKGQTLSSAAGGYPDVFSKLFVSMMKAGEESGKLADSLSLVAVQMEGVYKLKGKIRGAMIYPVVIISIMLIIGILMLVLVVPGITATFKDLNVTLPFATRVFIGFSDFLKNNIIVSLVLLVVAVLGIYFSSRSEKGKKVIDYVLLKIPVISELIKETNSARITRTLSSLISAGVPFAESIKITGDVVQNYYFKTVLEDAKNKVEKGENISSVFLNSTNLCPVFVGEMMSVGEETGKLPDMLMEVAVFYENSVDQKTKDMSTIVEPVLMVIIGLAVGFFAFAMITPIYSLMDTI